MGNGFDELLFEETPEGGSLPVPSKLPLIPPESPPVEGVDAVDELAIVAPLVADVKTVEEPLDEEDVHDGEGADKTVDEASSVLIEVVPLWVCVVEGLPEKMVEEERDCDRTVVEGLDPAVARVRLKLKDKPEDVLEDDSPVGY